MIRWFTNNGIAANLLMIGILLGGIYTAFRLPLEVIPSTEWQTVSMEIKYPGATPKDVEKGVLIISLFCPHLNTTFSFCCKDPVPIIM